MHYDPQTEILMKEVKVLDDRLDGSILGKLAQLEKKAAALGDDYLLGFTYYYYSYVK